MSLFKNITEIKDFIPVTASFKFEEIKPFLIQAERNYIIPMVSKTQFDELNTAYNASETPTLSPAQVNLLYEIRLALAPLMYWLWIPHGQVKVSGGGIQITSTPTVKTAFQWQVDKLEESAFNNGFFGLENLLEFLEENKATYTLWKASESYTISKELFINSAKEFNEQYPINNSRYLFLQMRSFSKIIERENIKGILGKPLYDLVKASLIAEATSQIDYTFIENEVALVLENELISSYSIQLVEFPFVENSLALSFLADGSGNNAYVIDNSHIISIDYNTGLITCGGFDEVIISGTFYANYQTSITTTTEPTLYPELLEYIKPVVAYGTLLKAATRLSLVINDKGVSIFNNNNSQTTQVLQGAEDKRLQMSKEDIKYEFDSSTQALMNFLNENHADYPDYPYIETNFTRFENKESNKFFYGGQ